MFRQIGKAAAALLILALSATAWAVDYDDPYKMIEEVASITFDRMKSQKTQIDDNPDMLRDIVEQELLPYVDYKFSALKVLGKHARKVPKDKLGEFVKVFREYLVTTYAVVMGYYDDQTVIFEPGRDFSKKKTVTVRVVIQDEDRPDIKIAFKVRKNKKTNQWKAYDMIAEGISVLSSKQSEFGHVLRRDGIDVVISMMRDKISKPIVLDTQEAE